MSAEPHQEPNYIAVFWALLTLTLIEVGVFYMHIGRVYFVTALVMLALMKAFLVAWFFMHLRSERWTLVFMTIIPLLLAVDLLLGLMPDIGHIPY
jgi:cytochrome c oxidase subunit IV